MNVAKLTALRERYSPEPIPTCRLCGAEMSAQRISGSRITYACTGATYDDTGCHYAPGRNFVDEHYEQSQVTVVDVSDPDVIDLIAALEAARADCRENAARIAELESQRKLAFSACNRWSDKCREAERRVAELEASHEKLREALASIHNTIRLDGLNAPLAAIMSRAKHAHEESAVAGINLRRGESNHG